MAAWRVSTATVTTVSVNMGLGRMDMGARAARGIRSRLPWNSSIVDLSVIK